MLKRLNFLRNSLESHNPRETTQHLREQALKRRDERILELWKNDLDKPSVYEMVQQMKRAKEEENMHSSKFNNMLNSIGSDINNNKYASALGESQQSIDSLQHSDIAMLNQSSQAYGLPLAQGSPTRSGQGAVAQASG